MQQKDGFAAPLAVEQPAGLIRLTKLPAVRELMLDRVLAIGEEAGAC